MQSTFNMYAVLVLVSLSLIATVSHGKVFETRQFDTRQQGARYKKMTSELRCLVCQNQNIADSNADLARDLRDKVYAMIMAGKTDAQIIDYMVARYGDFILYRPPLTARTLMLWLGPFLFLLFCLGLMMRYVRRRKRAATVQPALSEDQRQEAAKLLHS